MRRRSLIRTAAGRLAEPATRGMPSPRIRDVSVIATAPEGVRLSVVKITTDQAGLYGYGCATFTQRADLVNAAIEKYLKPFLAGRPADRIDDLWQAMYNSSYWRNGPVLNNAISGVDQALWDIKGRQAGLPVYQLLGGKCREAAACYMRCAGEEIPEAIENAKAALAQGFRHVRVQVGVPQMAAYGSGGARLYGGGQGPRAASPAATGALHSAPLFESRAYMRRTLQTLEECRKQLGGEVELLHDVHERVTASEGVAFARELERFRLFYLEDLFSPEQIGWFRTVRTQCPIPIAMGELFNSPHEWTPLITERLIDYIRIHVSQAGGVTPCRKVAALGEIFGVRTAWHGPPDVSPVGHAANIALELACYNFGIHEYTAFGDTAREIFRNCPVARDGYVYAVEAPGWGIEVDEKLAAKFPYGHMERGDRQRNNGGWGEVRRLDGTIINQ